jgi:hypothetical protein
MIFMPKECALLTKALSPCSPPSILHARLRLVRAVYEACGFL